MARLLKTERVLTRAPGEGGVYRWESRDDDTGEVHTALEMDAVTAEEFGKPVRVTVTIVAGDQLNVPA